MKRLVTLLLLAACTGPVLGQDIRCGIPPIPPVGCKVGPCVCDATGNNCQYQMICGR